MNQQEAIKRLHSAMKDCNDSGWVITGKLELIKARDKSFASRNLVTGSLVLLMTVKE